MRDKKKILGLLYAALGDSGVVWDVSKNHYKEISKYRKFIQSIIDKLAKETDDTTRKLLAKSLRDECENIKKKFMIELNFMKQFQGKCPNVADSIEIDDASA